MLKEKFKENPTFIAIVSTIYNLLNCNNIYRYYRRNTIQTKGAFLKKVRFKISGNNNTISFGKMAQLKNCTIEIYGNNCEIKIGGGHTHITNTSFYCEDDNSKIIIGSCFTMESGHIASTEGEIITIGNDCMFSNDIEIRNGDSHSIIENGTLNRTNWANPVRIGDHVWLTAHVRIMKGTEVASQSIIANSSLVSSKLKIPNPAKLIKIEINWDRNRYKYKRE